MALAMAMAMALVMAMALDNICGLPQFFKGGENGKKTNKNEKRKTLSYF